MMVIKICFCFAFCIFCLCAAFVFCLRAWHLHKNEKIDPVNVVNPPAKIRKLTKIMRDERVRELIERG